MGEKCGREIDVLEFTAGHEEQEAAEDESDFGEDDAGLTINSLDVQGISFTGRVPEFASPHQKVCAEQSGVDMEGHEGEGEEDDDGALLNFLENYLLGLEGSRVKKKNNAEIRCLRKEIAMVKMKIGDRFCG